MDFTLRRANPGDLDAVMALEQAGFPPGIVEERAVFARRIEAFPEGFLLAEGPSRGVWGYLCVEVWSNWGDSDRSDPRRFHLGHDIADWLDRNGDVLYVASMTVAPEARGAGAGHRLFRRALERLSKEFPRTRRVALIVNELWPAARRLYEGEGFSVVGQLPGFFRPTSGPVGDALLMEKETGAV